jgi:hypothetical protein
MTDHMFSTVNSFLPYVGWVTIIMTEKPFIKVYSYLLFHVFSLKNKLIKLLILVILPENMFFYMLRAPYPFFLLV